MIAKQYRLGTRFALELLEFFYLNDDLLSIHFSYQCYGHRKRRVTERSRDDDTDDLRMCPSRSTIATSARWPIFLP